MAYIAMAEKVHEEWRQKCRDEMAADGVLGPAPQWRRIALDEYCSDLHIGPGLGHHIGPGPKVYLDGVVVFRYKAWSATLPPAELAEHDFFFLLHQVYALRALGALCGHVRDVCKKINLRSGHRPPVLSSAATQCFGAARE